MRITVFQAASTGLIGIVAIIIAFALPPRGGGVGVLPLIVGIVLLAASVVLVLVARRRVGR